MSRVHPVFEPTQTRSLLQRSGTHTGAVVCGWVRSTQLRKRRAPMTRQHGTYGAPRLWSISRWVLVHARKGERDYRRRTSACGVEGPCGYLIPPRKDERVLLPDAEAGR
eukprot:1144491-Pelagomonas_calceolata.AAC.2